VVKLTIQIIIGKKQHQLCCNDYSLNIMHISGADTGGDSDRGD